MQLWDYRALRQQADAAAAAAAPALRRIMLLFVLVPLALGLLLSAAGLALENWAGSISGLSALGTRTLLLNLSRSLAFLPTILAPFWVCCYLSCTLAAARRQDVTRDVFLTGFHRWGRILSGMLLLALRFLWIHLLFSLVGSTLYVFIFGAERAQAVMASADPTGDLPTQITAFAILGAGLIFFFLRYRLAYYVILDQPDKPVIFCMQSGSFLSRKGLLPLLSTDLHLLWFWLPVLAAAAVSCADLFFPGLAPAMGVSENAVYFLSQLLSGGLLLILGLVWGNRAALSYACAYYRLKSTFLIEPEAASPSSL